MKMHRLKVKRWPVVSSISSFFNIVCFLSNCHILQMQEKICLLELHVPWSLACACCQEWFSLPNLELSHVYLLFRWTDTVIVSPTDQTSLTNANINLSKWSCRPTVYQHFVFKQCRSLNDPVFKHICVVSVSSVISMRELMRKHKLSKNVLIR